MEIIAIANHKGGCGKTTTSINLAYALSLKKKVLLLDLDPQGHATLGLNIGPDSVSKSIFDVLHPTKPTKLKSAVLPIYDNLDLLPGNTRSAALEQMLAGKSQREYRLRNVLSKLKDYDYVIIDTAPSLGLLTINALLAATKVIIPVEPSNYSLHGLTKLEETLEWLNTKCKHQPKVRYVLTLYNSNSSFCVDFENTLTRSFQDQVFQVRISHNDIYKDSTVLGAPVLRYANHFQEAHEYSVLAAEVIAWSEGREPVFFSSLPKRQTSALPLPGTTKAKTNYIEILRKTNENYQYKYIIDMNGKVHSVKTKSLQINEKVLH